MSINRASRYGPLDNIQENDNVDIESVSTVTFGKHSDLGSDQHQNIPQGAASIGRHSSSSSSSPRTNASEFESMVPSKDSQHERESRIIRTMIAISSVLLFLSSTVIILGVIFKNKSKATQIDSFSANTQANGDSKFSTVIIIESDVTEAPQPAPSQQVAALTPFNSTTTTSLESLSLTEVPTTEPTSAPTTGHPSKFPSLIPSLLPTDKPSLYISGDCEDSKEKVYFSEYQGIYCNQLRKEDCSDVYYKMHCQKTCNTCGMTSFPTEQPTPGSFPDAVAHSSVPTAVPTPKLSIPSMPSLTPSILPTLSLQPSSMIGVSPRIPPTKSSIPSTRPSETPSSQPISTSETPSNGPSEAPSSLPLELPTSLPSEVPTSLPSEVPSSLPSEEPAHSPSAVPSMEHSEVPSSHPSAAPSMFIPKTEFYVIGGDFGGPERAGLEKRLSTLPSFHGKWLFHLGDFNDILHNGCKPKTYKNFGALFSHSSVPVYLLAGDHEWNDCSDPESALSDWSQFLGNYDATHWDEPTEYTVKRTNAGPNMFAFAYNRVLYVGVNVLSGLVHDRNEWDEQHKASLRWLEDNVMHNKNDVDLIVIVGHAAQSDNNEDFFGPLTSSVKRWNTMTVYFHHSMDQSGTGKYVNKGDNLIHVSVQGSSWPPLKIVVDVMKKDFHIAEDSWYTEPPSQSPVPSKIPTSYPSSKPTHLPSDSPTSRPFSEPTHLPSDSPSSRPSSKPTHLPSDSPSFTESHQPSTDHTSVPSESPTDVPSSYPVKLTSSPSMNPTAKPSKFPTALPTNNPTPSQSSKPSSKPTILSSMSPTTNPTRTPTQKPIQEASHSPTQTSTVPPTKLPTNPTQSPSTQPTKPLTDKPTNAPTIPPTNLPTKKPSQLPTVQPTT